jgi:uncharacterized membrane protein
LRRTIFASLLGIILVLFAADSALADTIALQQAVQAGNVGQYQFEISNQTSKSHHYQLAVQDLPNSLRLTFVQDGPVLDAVSVDANSYGQVTLRAEVPFGVPIGRYAGAIIATRDDGVVLKVPIVLNVENTYALRIVNQNLNVTTFSGQEFTFEVTASNAGAAPLTNLTLVLDGPSKWVPRVEPAVVGSLAPGAEMIFHAAVLVPQSQIAIDQPVSLSVSSDQVSTAKSVLTIRVQNRPDYLIVVGIVLAAAAIGVLAYFRVRGRR